MSKFITNQNIELQLVPAGLGERILAFVIDVLILGSYGLFLVWLGSFTDRSNVIFFAVPAFFYSLLFEIFADGQSPGKKARNIRVVKINGGSPAFINYLLRWIMRPVDFLLYGVPAILFIVFTENGQRLGDLAGGTTVVKTQESVYINDIKTYKDDNHRVIYPQVRRLSDKQIEMIREALHLKRDGYGSGGVPELTVKVKKILMVDDELPDVKFLYTIIRDYEYLAAE